MKPGTPEAEKAYYKAFDKEVDKYFSPDFFCWSCGSQLTGEEEDCTECGREQLCPKCGGNDLGHGHQDETFALPETDWEFCLDCGYQWGHQ